MSDKTTLTSVDEQRNATLLYLYNFCEQVHNHLTAIAKMRPMLNESCVIFRGSGNIRPIQCNAAVNMLKEIKIELQGFCQIFHSDINSIPLAFAILSYRSLAPVNHANEQIVLLINLIESFRIDCMMSSPSTLQQRKSIFIAFDQLSSILYSIPLQFMDIKVEARQITLEFVLEHQHVSYDYL